MIDVWVTGSSLPALDAALSLAEVGMKVRVSVDETTDGLPVGPQRDPDGALAALVARVGAPLPVASGGGGHEAPELRVFPPTPVLLRGADGALHPLDSTAVVGIPTTPLATEITALLGSGGAFRAYLDRLRPVLKIGKEQSLGVLVRSRLGAQAETLLVEPHARELAGVPAAELDAARVAPGLNEALSRVGSLSGAALSYGDRNVARETTVEPVGGWAALRAALLERLALYAVELVADRPVTALGRGADGNGWLVRTGTGADASDEAVRGVIIDVTGSPRLADAHGFAEHPVLVAPSTRQYAEIGIERPEWLPEEFAEELPALIMLPENDATSGWVVRVAPREGRWVARFAGPRQAAEANAAQLDLAALCAAAQVTALPGGMPPAIWGAVGMPTSVEEDRARLQAIRDFDSEHAALRPVGATWAGGDHALAVAEAIPRVVELRRELLGLA